MRSGDGDLARSELTSALAASAHPEVRVILGLAPAYRSAWIVADAYPVATVAGDNLALHRALVSAPSGSVIVAHLDGPASAGHWGELMSQAAQVRGLAGLILAGAVRDLGEIERLRFPVFHEGTDPRPATKHEPGMLGVSAQIHGTLVEPGDLVCADADGIAIVPARLIREVLESARTIRGRELDLFDRVAAGESTVDLLGLPGSTSDTAPF